MTLSGSVNGAPVLTFLRDFANRHVRSLDDSSAPCSLLRDDRILRVMIVRNEVPPAFVEWVDR
jgi:hypothetical protein